MAHPDFQGPDTTPVPETTSAARSGLVGILWMLLSTLVLAGMHTTIHYVSANVHPFQVVFFRLFFALLVVVPFFVRDGLGPLRTQRFKMLGARAVLNFAAMVCFFTALSLSPVADVTALSFTSPLFAALLAVLILKERIGIRRVFAILAGFAGTLIVLRPGFTEISLGYALVLVAAVFWSSCVIIVKDLSRTESAATITTYMSLMMAPMALVPAMFVWTWPSAWDLTLLIGLGCLGGVGQFAMSQALKHAETHVVMPFDFLRLLWVALMGYMFFAEIPDLFIWIGGALIFSSTAYITLRERRRAQRV